MPLPSRCPQGYQGGCDRPRFREGLSAPLGRGTPGFPAAESPAKLSAQESRFLPAPHARSWLAERPLGMHFDERSCRHFKERHAACQNHVGSVGNQMQRRNCASTQRNDCLPHSRCKPAFWFRRKSLIVKQRQARKRLRIIQSRTLRHGQNSKGSVRTSPTETGAQAKGNAKQSGEVRTRGTHGKPPGRERRLRPVSSVDVSLGGRLQP